MSPKIITKDTGPTLLKTLSMNIAFCWMTQFRKKRDLTFQPNTWKVGINVNWMFFKEHIFSTLLTLKKY